MQYIMNKLRIARPIRRAISIMVASSALVGMLFGDENIMIQEDNMKELKCSLPNDRFRLVGSNAPGRYFWMASKFT